MDWHDATVGEQFTMLTTQASFQMPKSERPISMPFAVSRRISLRNAPRICFSDLPLLQSHPLASRSCGFGV